MFRGKQTTTSYLGHRRFADLKENTTAFDAMTPFYTNRLAVGSGDATREMEVATSGADLWRMFDVKPVIGRFFSASEDLPPDGTRVAVLSYEFWQTEFGGRRNVLGTLVDIGPAKYTIVGVAPEGFVGFSPGPVVAFIPHAAYSSAITSFSDGKTAWYDTYFMTWFEVFARRKPGVTKAAADADLSHAFVLSYEKQHEANPKSAPITRVKPSVLAGPVLADRGPNESNDARVATWLVGIAAIVLLIACANVANLLLARALKRRREIAVRIALGVSRGRLLMQLMTESVLLAMLGGVAGLAIAQWGGTAMRQILLNGELAGTGVFADRRVLVVVAALALAAGLLTGIAPVFQTRREDVSAALKAGAREGTVHRTRLRAALLVAQAALSVVLLVGAGLFLRSFVNVQNVHLGFDSDRLLYVGLADRGMAIDSSHAVLLREELAARARRVPGVDNAARALTVPLSMMWQLPLFLAGIDSAVNKVDNMTLQAGSPELLATMGTSLLRGRGISAEDREHTPRVMVISESMAKKLWPGEDAIGKCIRIRADTMPCITVVGIAADVRSGSLSEIEMHYYLPIDQFERAGGGLFVRTHGPAAEKADEVRRALQQLMPGVSYVRVVPMTTIIAPEIRSWRIGAIMFAVFGMLALVLAAVGLYSVIAYNVTQRTHERGVRVALGAQGADVIRLVVREGLKIVVPGVALGAIIALVAGRWVAPLLFDVSPRIRRYSRASC